MPSNADDATCDALVTGSRILDRERLTDAFGHLSSRRDAGAVTITARIGPGLVRDRDDLVDLDLEGEVLAGDGALVPGEAALHLGILRARPDVGAVCRFHGAATLAWSTLGLPLPPYVSFALALGGTVPVYDTALTVTKAAEADELAAQLRDGLAIVMRGFGAVTVGATVPEAVVRATLLERSAEAALRATAAGEPRAYEDAQARAFLARRAVVDEQIARAWTFLQRRWPAGEPLVAG